MHSNLLTDAWRQQLGHYQQLFVGFSGGLDSTVLLHCLAQEPQLHQKLQAVYIHHGLSVHATAWQHHAQSQCEQLDIPFMARHVQINTHANIEEQARLARYRVFADLLNKDDCFLVAHHRDDQAETLLLQLLRGAGIDGLAAMAAIKKLGQGLLARPFLEHARQDLLAYAQKHQLQWIEDESNQDSVFSRNYLRHQVMPLLEARWAGVADNLVRSAMHCQQAKDNLEALAYLDCVELNDNKETLNLLPIAHLNSSRLSNVLRVWLKNQGIRAPSTVLMQRMIDELIQARKDANPQIAWSGVVMRRYQHSLYLLKKKPSKLPSIILWATFPEPLLLTDSEEHALYLCSIPDEQGIYIPQGQRLEVRFSAQGESFFWHGQTKQLKKLWQQWQVPPWHRDEIPLLYINQELAAVVGFAINDHYFSQKQADTYRLELRRHRKA